MAAGKSFMSETLTEAEELDIAEAIARRHAKHRAANALRREALEWRAQMMLGNRNAVKNDMGVPRYRGDGSSNPEYMRRYRASRKAQAA